VADDVTLLPTPLQSPRIPIWIAARTANAGPLRRAARFEGLFAIEVDVDRLTAMTEAVARLRGDLDGFDVVVVSDGSRDVARDRRIGVTWWMSDVEVGETRAGLARLVAAGPPGV
jgi:alkanesulfonate monooxygenase SsuD/methylene tetrahydromethanopterin reductase-like flavin-dependent oxidoreductase (luciferase family)